MKITFKPVARRSNLVVQNLDGETLIYDLETNKALCLNQTSAIIWQHCNGKNEISEISNNISGQLKSSVSEDLIWLALEQLKNENLLENKQEFSTGFNHLSRREVIKRVGLATAIALPIVSSVIVPNTAYGAASSCIPNNSTCTQSAQCCSNCCKDTGGGINECKPGGGACLP